MPATASGAGPHVIQYTSSGTKTVTVTATYQGSETIETTDITVSSCPSNVTGSVKDLYGNGLQGANVRLYKDVDLDGIADDAVAIRSVFTTVSGGYSMVGMTPGSYVVTVPVYAGYTISSASDINAPDGDLGIDLSPTDNVIPTTLGTTMIDSGYNFIFAANTGTIAGTVFDNLANPISGAVINIYEDDDLDGIPGVLIDSGVTDINGVYSIGGLQSGKYALGSPSKSYVIELEVPVGYTIVSGIDASEDLDLVANTPTTDNLIPCTLDTAETDSHNNFIIQL